MSSNSFFSGLLSSVFERGVSFSRAEDRRTAVQLCDALLSGRGEASGTKVARALFTTYEQMSFEERQEFFLHLNENLDVSSESATLAAAAYSADTSVENLKRMRQACEPRRLELLRKLNGAPGGTEQLVRMREDLIAMLPDLGRLSRTDADFEYLFNSWFNRGFLVMRPIDWKTPAHILEKIIDYEAVHEITSWDDLRRRLLPEDRRCYAFFHPVMPDEPLIFVEIALTDGIATSIQDVLREEREQIPETDVTTAVFYSISNCQDGLKGVSFGNFLIKQVASDLAQDLPQLSTFVTLSPVPGFMRWLRGLEEEGEVLPAVREAIERNDPALLEPHNTALMELAARYFIKEKRTDGQPIDPVARFHLGNGASLRQINPMADVSVKGVKQSAGLMVNYLYDLRQVEANHEAYVAERKVNAHKSITSLAG